MTISHGSGVWCKFTADYNYRQPSYTVAYKAGMVLNIPTPHATLAIAAGKAIRLKKTRKDEEPWPVSEVAQAPSTDA